MRILLAFFSCMLFLATHPAWAQGQPGNPAPLGGDLVIPGPQGQHFAFRPVSIGAGANPLSAQKRFTLGNPQDYLGEKPTDITIGGSFLLEKGETEDWVYYMGKYEVTEAQYYSISGLPQGMDKAKLASNLPITGISVFDALTFIEKLNDHFYTHAMNSVPKVRAVPGFIRLPTEPEWEFAARGGNATPANLFGNNTPYEGTLAAYEWFSGPSSSHNKLQEIGLLKPNPLGIHDMLGNASELIVSPYHIDYYQGRPGGYTSRGGNFFTQEKDIRASLRQEEPLYIGNADKGMKPNKKTTMGFRLVLVAPVLPDKEAIQDIKDIWDEYVASSERAATPAGRSMATVDQQTDAKVSDAESYVSRIRGYVENSNAPEDIRQALASVHALMRDISSIRKETDKRIAEAFVDVATTTGARLGREISKRPKLEALLESAKTSGDATTLARYTRMVEGVEGNINTDAANLYKILQSLISLNPELVNGAMQGHLSYLNDPARVGKAEWPLAALPQIRNLYDVFYKKKGLSNDEMMHALEQIVVATPQ